MDMNLLYLVGPPGVGKSSAMAALTAQCHRVPRSDGLMRWDVLARPQTPPETARIVGVELGARREKFSGTDALGMSVNPQAVDWVQSGYRDHGGLVLAEGARLANTRFLTAAQAAGYTVTVVHLGAPDSVLEDRRLARGSSQDPAWVRGGTTRAYNIASAMSHQGADVHFSWTDGLSPEDVAAWMFDRFEWLAGLR